MGKRNRTDRGIFERPTGSGIWCIRYVDQNGRLHREKIGPKGLAKLAYQKRKTAVREGKLFPQQIGRQRVIKLDELICDFLAYSQLHKRSYRTDRGKAQGLLKRLGQQPATAISPQDLDHLKEFLITTRSPTTVNRYLALLRGIFNHGIRNRKVEYNPVSDVKFFPENNVRVRYLTDNEEASLFQALPTRHHALVEVALFTGLRASNLFSLQWSHIDLDAAVYTAPFSKNGFALRLEMHSRVREILATLPRNGSPYVFPGVNKEKPRRDISCSFRKAVRQAGISAFRFHDLRHTWASRLAMAGVPLFTIMELGGWKTLKNVQRYAHLSPGHRREALERLTPRPTDTSSDTSAKSSNVERSGETGNDAKSLGPEGGVDHA